MRYRFLRFDRLLLVRLSAEVHLYKIACAALSDMKISLRKLGRNRRNEARMRIKTVLYSRNLYTARRDYNFATKGSWKIREI